MKESPENFMTYKVLYEYTINSVGKDRTNEKSLSDYNGIMCLSYFCLEMCLNRVWKGIGVIDSHWHPYPFR